MQKMNINDKIAITLLQSDDKDRIEMLKEFAKQVNYPLDKKFKDEYGVTGLLSHAQNLDDVMYLVDRDVPMTYDEYGENTLSRFVCSNDVDIVEYLLNKFPKSDVNFPHAGAGNQTPIMLAKSKKMIDLLVKHGADLEFKSDIGTPLAIVVDQICYDSKNGKAEHPLYLPTRILSHLCQYKIDKNPTIYGTPLDEYIKDIPGGDVIRDIIDHSISTKEIREDHEKNSFLPSKPEVKTIDKVENKVDKSSKIKTRLRDDMEIS